MNESSNGEETIFAEALRLPPEERAAYLAQSTDGNPDLRRAVESLLSSYASGDFLERAAVPELHQTLRTTVPLAEKTGDAIGRYKLLQQIGEGGCGVVYMAEQLEPVRRRVALKIIKLGLDTKSVIARFEAERQALAMMDHPNIAKVFDAGATETGRPYFVMELIRGLRITDYCDEAKLPTRARLDLFLQVCQAIQHAHQKGIIHRDIKPSNILVTVNDGVPVPKVIDFGIAKATSGQQLTDKTIFTAFEQFIGTPAYMSPEQAVMTSLDIDTRSDIYALGVLLYELLTGKTPFEAKELLAIGLDAMRRTIREQEPPRPSTRLSTLAQDELNTTAQRRGLDAPKLVSELRGDLDWIVMKCLEKDRSRRYETANGLAMDIERHVHNEPVVACPPSRLYRLQKMVRRNKLGFAAGSAVAASLVIGLSLSTVLFFRERAARKQANQQQARASEQAGIASAVNEFLLQDLLRQADSRSQAEAEFAPNPNLTVREAVERAAERIGDRFKDQPLQEAAVRMAIGAALNGVGEAERATPHLQRAFELRRLKLGPEHLDTLRAMTSLAYSYQLAEKVDQAVPLYEQSLKLKKATLGPDHEDTLISMNNLAATYLIAGKLDESRLLQEETLKLKKRSLGPDNQETLGSMCNLGLVYMQLGKFDEALPLFEEALKRMKAKLSPSHPYIQKTTWSLAEVYRAKGKLDQALALHEEALNLRRANLGPDHPDILTSLTQLAITYAMAGKIEQSLPLFEESFRLTKAKFGLENAQTLGAMGNLAMAYTVTGKPEQALPLLEETLRLMKAKMGPDHPDTLRSMGQLAATHLELGQLDQALALGEETLQRMKGSAHEHPMMTFVMENLADTYRYSGKNRQAVELGQEAVKRTEAKNGKDHPDTLAALCKLIEFLAVTKNYTEAESSSRILLERVKQRTEALPETCVEALGSAGRILVSRKQWASAEPILRECLAIREKTQSNGWDTFNSRSMLGGALLGQGKVTEAQALVVGAYEQMEKMQETIAGANDKRDDWLDAMDRFETLYESCGDKPEAARWRTEIERVRRITDPGAVRRWLILTPIALARGQSSLTGMESEQIDHEADLRPLSGNKMSVNGRDLVWTEHALRDYTINFNELLGDETPWSVAYAVCYMKMAAPRKDLVLKVGSDDQARVYINGKKVYENRTNRGMILDEDTIDDVELRAGLNVVVFKVVNGRYGWRGALRFAEKDGQAVAGLKVTLEPE